MVSDESVEKSKTGRESGRAPSNRLKCGRVAELVNFTEIQICGPNHVGSPAFAEALARLGNRSASRLGESRSLAAATPEAVPCVYHGFSGSDIPVTGLAPVVLVAGSHQDAVDHCLIAQRIAGDLRIPVNCLADSALQEYLGCVELPSRLMFESRAPALPPEKSITADSLAPCFQSASSSLGRVHRPLMSFGPETARQALIACGRQAALARVLLDHGCFSAQTRLLQVQLLRPFPEQELVGHLQEMEQLIVLAQPDDPPNVELLAVLEVLAARHRDFPKLSISPLSGRPLTPSDLLSALPESLVQQSLEPGIRTTAKDSLQLQIGATPGGRWSRELLAESASAIIRATSPTNDGDSLQIRQVDQAADLTFCRLDIGATDEESNSLDLLFYTENNLVDLEPALEKLKHNGMLILHCESRDIAAVWQRLSAESKRMIEEKDIEAWWIRPWDLLDSSEDLADQSSQILSGALLKTLSAKLHLDSTPLQSAPLSILETAGAQAVRKFDPADHVAGQSQRQEESNATTASTQTPSNEKQWRQALRAFHLTGSGGWSESDPLPGLPLWPAVATKLIDDHKLAAYYPLMLPSPRDTTKQSAQTEYVSLLEALQGPSGESDNESSSDREDLESTVRNLEKVMETTPSLEISEIVAAALPDTSPENADRAGDPVLRERLSRLPESGRLIGFGPQTLSHFYSWAVAAQRTDFEDRFYGEVKQLIVGLRDLLQVDLSHRESQRAAESLAESMGEEASAFIDLDKLSRNLPDVSGSDALSDPLLELTRESLGVLQTFHASASQSVPFYVISAGEGPKFDRLPALAQFVSSDCFEAALGLVDGLLERMSRVFRAVRVARLLISGRYQPEIHDEVFARFEWQSCSDEEILLAPKVLVVESSTSINNKQTTESLNRLLRSGRPVHILITQDESGLTAEGLSGALDDLAAIAMANREAFVLQSTLARPDHLLLGLREIVRTVRPSIALVSSHPTSQPASWAWASELLAHYGRLAPCFRYSPELGSCWSDRIDISGNPQLETRQAVVNLASNSLPPASAEIDESVTFAHAASLRPEFRSHFRVIPHCAWSDDQQPIGAYLEEFESIPPASLPFIWVVRNTELSRAIMTREMANACRDRHLAWSRLQELAAINSQLASKAQEDVRQELEAGFQNEVENARAKARQEGTLWAVNRIVEELLGQKAPLTTADLYPETGNGGPFQSKMSTLAAAGPPETSKDSGKAEPTKEVQAALRTDPYIDTELCTSCNDCVNINPRLFVYNANNQAQIGDPLAGSFAELVKAAEKCPARCIHPGAPRAADKTATPAMIKRASKFR